MDWFDRENRARILNVNYFQHRAWQLLALNEKLSGTWPYQSRFVQLSLQILHFFGLSCMMFALLNGLRTAAADDSDIILENGFWISFTLGLTGMQIMNIIGTPHRRKFYERVVKHFRTMNSSEEAAVLGRSADDATIFVVIYLAAMAVFILIFYWSPMARAYYEYSSGQVDELEVALATGLDYGVDHEKYLFVLLPIYLNYFVSGFIAGAGFEFSFMLQVRHASAVLEIVRMRLDRAIKLIDDAEESAMTMVCAVELHMECHEMVDMIEENYSSFLFLILVANSAMFGVGLHMVTQSLNDPLEAVRFACVFALITLHFHVIYYHGQMITDADWAVHNARYQYQWMDMPKKSRRFFAMMMTMQSTNVCQLSSGRLFPLPMEMFGKMFKAGLSYYTVFEQ